ncbi:MAG: endonuclease NucS domain-containing protein, partial [Candidatus Dojkabacteria bacterium]
MERVMLEKDMEDFIVKNPELILQEEGLKLLNRQLRVGNYIFDLLFEDRRGGKLIVEIQKGTLDRNHTYKILDYYDEYKTNNPKDFIDVMIIANKIPYERRKRLDSYGIEWREIPMDNFPLATNQNINEQKNILSPNHDDSIEYSGKKLSKSIESSVFDSYNLFKSQRDKIITGLLEIDPKGQPLLNWKNLGEDNIKSKKNWFSGFRPSSWGRHKGSGFGVAFWFYYRYENNLDSDFIHVAVGCESPLKSECKEAFKEKISNNVTTNRIPLADFDLYPDAGIRKGSIL